MFNEYFYLNHQFSKISCFQDCLRFSLALSKNIPNCKLFVGEFKDLKQKVGTGEIAYKEHPLNTNYHGIEFEREYLSSITGYHKSFFLFGKNVKKRLFGKARNQYCLVQKRSQNSRSSAAFPC